jgi:hypothetical protein
MAEWSIIPNDGASINSEGVATFQANNGTTEKTYIITYTDDNGCSGSTEYKVPPREIITTCELVLSSSDGSFPCSASTYENWIFGYEVYTVTDGDRRKTDEGFQEGTLTIYEDNCDGIERTLLYNGYSSVFEIDLDILDEHQGCTITGEFTQDGGAAPTHKIINSCSDVSFADGANFNNKNGIYIYNGHNGSVTFPQIHPVFQGEWAACKSVNVTFGENSITPVFDGGDTHDDRNYYVLCQCCMEPQVGVTAGTIGEESSNSASIEAYMLDKINWGLIKIDGTKSTLTRTDSNINSVSLQYTANGTSMYMDDACNWQQDVQTPVGLDAIIEFEIYKDQTTGTGETLKCSFEVYIDLRSNQ